MAQDEMPLQRGSLKIESQAAQQVHGLVDVRFVMLDVTDGNGKREALLAAIAGGDMVIIPNNGKPAQRWLKDAVFAKLKITSGGTEQI